MQPAPTKRTRMQQTRLAITRHCRELTAETGFNGFTIEQVCERVGISRRTFFNYFPTKLEAVFGHDNDELPEGALERFMSARPEGIEGISPTLLADLVQLILEQLSFDETSIIGTHGFFKAAHREPELLEHLVQIGPKKEAEFLELISQREGVSPDHPALIILLHTLRLASIKSIENYVQAPAARSLGETFLDFMSQVQPVLSQPLHRASH